MNFFLGLNEIVPCDWKYETARRLKIKHGTNVLFELLNMIWAMWWKQRLVQVASSNHDRPWWQQGLFQGSRF